MMKYLAATLAAACAVLLGVVAYQAVPDKAAKPQHSAAYQRIDGFLAALKGHRWKEACEVLSWYSANRFVTDDGCALIMRYQFAGKMAYKMIGDTIGRAGHYTVVTALIVQDDATTKRNEVAACEAKWADGKDCVWAGVYTFGMQLAPAVKDAFANPKKAAKHWFITWID